jgi:transcriptional regulator with XRE-family HTH domain
MSNDFGSWLRWAREEAGMSQRKLASIVGVSDSAICLWESNKRSPKHGSRVLLIQVLGAGRGF